MISKYVYPEIKCCNTQLKTKDLRELSRERPFASILLVIRKELS